ncbi:hypothetical protein D3C72_2102310 [compost metagenome]
MPSLPVTSLNTQYTVHRLRYPATAPHSASARGTWMPKALTISPSHMVGSTSTSGSSWWSASIRLRASRHQVSGRATNASTEAPKRQATTSDSSALATSTTG